MSQEVMSQQGEGLGLREWRLLVSWGDLMTLGKGSWRESGWAP